MAKEYPYVEVGTELDTLVNKRVLLEEEFSNAIPLDLKTKIETLSDELASLHALRDSFTDTIKDNINTTEEQIRELIDKQDKPGSMQHGRAFLKYKSGSTTHKFSGKELWKLMQSDEDMQKRLMPYHEISERRSTLSIEIKSRESVMAELEEPDTIPF